MGAALGGHIERDINGYKILNVLHQCIEFKKRHYTTSFYEQVREAEEYGTIPHPALISRHPMLIAIFDDNLGEVKELTESNIPFDSDPKDESCKSYMQPPYSYAQILGRSEIVAYFDRKRLEKAAFEQKSNEIAKELVGKGQSIEQKEEKDFSTERKLNTDTTDKSVEMEDVRKLVKQLIVSDHKGDNTTQITARIVHDAIDTTLCESIKCDTLFARDGIISASIAMLKDSGLTASAVGEDFSPDRSRPITTQTPYNIMSITKFIVMNVIMQLEAEGKLSLDDTISKYIDEDVPNKENIKIAHLLDHHSGLRDKDYLQIRKKDPLSVLLHPEVIDEAGKSFRYANINFVIASKIIEKATSDSFESQIKKLIKSPLGLSHLEVFDDNSALPFAHGYKFNTESGTLNRASDFHRWGATNIRTIPAEVAIIYKNFFENEGYMPATQRAKVLKSFKDIEFKVVTPTKTHSWPATIGYGIEKHFVELENGAKIAAYGNGGWQDSNAAFVLYTPDNKTSYCVTCTKTQGLVNLKDRFSEAIAARNEILLMQPPSVSSQLRRAGPERIISDAPTFYSTETATGSTAAPAIRPEVMEQTGGQVPRISSQTAPSSTILSVSSLASSPRSDVKARNN